MKILLLDQFSDPGGAQECLLDVLPAMRARGWDLLVGLPGNGKVFERVRAMGVEAVPIHCGEGRDVPRLASEIRDWSRRFGAELVYLNGPRLLPGAVLAASGLPVVFHSHNRLQRGRRVAGISLAVLEARVIASCRYVAEQWSGYARQLTVIYNGVRGPGAALTARQGPPVIGCIGRISPEKGQLEFLRVAAQVCQRRPDCRFAIFGAPLFSDPAYERRVREAAEGLPVEFRGWAPSGYAALAELDLLLVPSIGHEATTRVILEAYAAGVPVIAFPTGGISEVVEEGRTGFLARSTEEMADLSVEVLSRSNETLRERARERWRREFTVEQYQDRIIDTLIRSK